MLIQWTSHCVKHQYQITYPDNKRLITPSLKYPLGEAGIIVDDKGGIRKNGC